MFTQNLFRHCSIISHQAKENRYSVDRNLPSVAKCRITKPHSCIGFASVKTTSMKKLYKQPLQVRKIAEGNVMYTFCTRGDGVSHTDTLVDRD